MVVMGTKTSAVSLSDRQDSTMTTKMIFGTAFCRSRLFTCHVSDRQPVTELLHDDAIWPRKGSFYI